MSDGRDSRDSAVVLQGQPKIAPQFIAEDAPSVTGKRGYDNRPRPLRPRKPAVDNSRTPVRGALMSKSFRIVKITIQVRILSKRLELVNHLETIGKFAANCCQENFSGLVKTVAFLLTPGTRIGWVVPVEGFAIPIVQTVNLLRNCCGKRQVGGVYRISKSIRRDVVASPQCYAATVVEEESQDVRRRHFPLIRPLPEGEEQVPLKPPTVSDRERRPAVFPAGPIRSRPAG